MWACEVINEWYIYYEIRSQNYSCSGKSRTNRPCTRTCNIFFYAESLALWSDPHTYVKSCYCGFSFSLLSFSFFLFVSFIPWREVIIVEKVKNKRENIYDGNNVDHHIISTIYTHKFEKKNDGKIDCLILSWWLGYLIIMITMMMLQKGTTWYMLFWVYILFSYVYVIFILLAICMATIFFVFGPMMVDLD